MTRSACLPGSIEPISDPSPREQAALIVTAARASAGARPISTHAIDITSGRLTVGLVPGLQSVARATGMPASMSRRAGAKWCFPRNQLVAGSNVATTGWPASAVRASAASPSSDGAARWSADRQPSSAASSAPPDGASSSAWRRSARP